MELPSGARSYLKMFQLYCCANERTMKQTHVKLFCSVQMYQCCWGWVPATAAYSSLSLLSTSAVVPYSVRSHKRRHTTSTCLFPQNNGNYITEAFVSPSPHCIAEQLDKRKKKFHMRAPTGWRQWCSRKWVVEGYNCTEGPGGNVSLARSAGSREAWLNYWTREQLLQWGTKTFLWRKLNIEQSVCLFVLKHWRKH